MKKLIIVAIVTLLAMPVYAQQKNVTNKKAEKTAIKNAQKNDDMQKKVYDEDIDPMMQIEQALEEARNTNRLVICQVGGNWCPWCLRFANFITTDKEIDNFVREHFVYIHLNTSKEHKNPEMLKRLGNPGRFGYPVLVVLGRDGEVLHIQNSSYLEEEKSYNRKRVMEFFQNWTIKAIEDLK